MLLLSYIKILLLERIPSSLSICTLSCTFSNTLKGLYFNAEAIWISEEYRLKHACFIFEST